LVAGFSPQQARPLPGRCDGIAQLGSLEQLLNIAKTLIPLREILAGQDLSVPNAIPTSATDSASPAAFAAEQVVHAQATRGARLIPSTSISIGLLPTSTARLPASLLTASRGLLTLALLTLAGLLALALALALAGLLALTLAWLLPLTRLLTLPRLLTFASGFLAILTRAGLFAAGL